MVFRTRPRGEKLWPQASQMCCGLGVNADSASQNLGVWHEGQEAE